MSKISFLFAVLWVACFLLFPVWIIPETGILRVLLFLTLFIYIAINIILIEVVIRKMEFADISLPSVRQLIQVFRKHYVLVALLIASFMLHLPLLLRPLNVTSDEVMHAPSGLLVLLKASLALRPLGISNLDFVGVPALLIFLLIAGVLWWYIRRGISLTAERYSLLVLVIVLGGLSIIECLLLYNLNVDTTAHRFPPLGRIAHAISTLLLGQSEFAARFPAWLFGALSATGVYLIVRFITSKTLPSLIATVIMLFTPAMFYYSGLAYLDTGQIFGTTLAIYYLIKYSRSQKPKEMFLSLWFASFGYMYRTVAFLVYAVILVYILVDVFRMHDKRLLKHNLVMFWFGLAPFLPWMIFESRYSDRKFPFAFGNWADIEVVTRHLRGLPNQLTLLVFAIFIISVFYLIIFKRTLAFYLFGSFFIINYGFLTTDLTHVVGYQRFATYFIPSITVIIGLAFGYSFEGLQKSKYRVLLMVLFAAVVVSLSVYLPVNPSGREEKYGYDKLVDSRSLFKKLKPFVQEPNKKMLVFTNTGVPLHYYSFREWRETRFMMISFPKLDLKEVYSQLKKLNTEYVLACESERLYLDYMPSSKRSLHVWPQDAYAGKIISFFEKNKTLFNFVDEFNDRDFRAVLYQVKAVNGFP